MRNGTKLCNTLTSFKSRMLPLDPSQAVGLTLEFNSSETKNFETKRLETYLFVYFQFRETIETPGTVSCFVFCELTKLSTLLIILRWDLLLYWNRSDTPKHLLRNNGHFP